MQSMRTCSEVIIYHVCQTANYAYIRVYMYRLRLRYTRDPLRAIKICC